jgi:uncharacterized protein YdiU (UPF0061 family)
MRAGEAVIPFDNSYVRLPERFYARQAPTPVAAPRLIKVNGALAHELGLDAGWLASPDGVAVLAGNRVPEGAEPIATAYAGHQFGGFVPQLGDGRAVLLGEVIGRDGVRRDIQLKGSGPTPFSRRGDGRAALGPVLREYIVSEAMAALGIPTTRALAAVTTGQPVIRENVVPGAVLARVAQSHIRVGTFQYFASRGDVDGLRTLADHVIARHYPEVRAAANPIRALLDGVVGRQARLVARWMHVGFIHGVMNTDNTSICGETIDYGPCAFLDAYHPAMVFSSIDHGGRYAFANQPRLAQWNLGRLAETLLPLIGPTQDEAIAEAQAAIDAFPAAFDAVYWPGWYAKLGFGAPRDGDKDLTIELLDIMADGAADFTLAFRLLGDVAADGQGAGDTAAEHRFTALFADPERITGWLVRWRARLAAEPSDAKPIDAAARRAAMQAVNPAFIPRNHRIEQAIVAAVAGDDFASFERLMTVLARPFDDQPDHSDLMAPPRPNEVVQATFCGT